MAVIERIRRKVKGVLFTQATPLSYTGSVVFTIIEANSGFQSAPGKSAELSSTGED